MPFVETSPVRDAANLALRVRVRGHVQGVGFRPFVKRLADELALAGTVTNDDLGVFIEVEGARDGIASFLSRLASEAPEASRVESIESDSISCGYYQSFEILASPSVIDSPCRTRVPRDRATCAECLRECGDPSDRRFHYPFTTCTTCGPRYTLLAAMPYERRRTSMRAFSLCPTCADEFGDTTDRRFHAEVMACPACGPTLSCHAPRSKEDAGGEEALRSAAEALNRGEIVALKGLGGYQLLTSADDDAAVRRLREKKRRPSKPLAVMVRSLAEAARYAELTPTERELLAAPENPIVLVSRRADSTLSANVAPNSGQVGLFLPTTPLHHLLLNQLTFPVIATSGNLGEEPILADDATPAQLTGLADVVLPHDRPIVRPLDDSVVRVIGGRPSVIRLARGYAPLPLPSLERWLDRHAADRFPPPMLALGGQQKNAVALWSGTQAVLGPHVGELDRERSRAAWHRHLQELTELYGADVQALVVDLHPDYAASRWAEESGLEVVGVAHHHAHAASAMVEHDLLDRTVLALTWDGTGLGPDGTLWGGEGLRASLLGCVRLATIRPIRLAGGDAAIRQPWRVGVALLRESLSSVPDSFWPELPREALRGVESILQREVCSPEATSMGRLFDGVASLLLGVTHVSHEGEAAGWLEARADPEVVECYPVALEAHRGVPAWDWRPMVRELLADRKRGVSVSVRAGRFHNTVAAWATLVLAGQPETDVVLSGGCFQNALLAERVIASLEALGHRVHPPGLIPVNDGGLAAGQLAIGLARRVGTV
jgi:hydrogenase maturation protein HypF